MDKNVAYIYNEILLSIKENETMPFTASWMELEIIILSEISQRKTIPYDITYLWNPKKKRYK